MQSVNISLSKQNELSVKASEELSLEDLINLTLSANLALMNSIMEDAPEDKAVQIKEHLFNTFNIAASALLAQFAPDIELRPDITEEAILRHEFEIANDKLSNM